MYNMCLRTYINKTEFIDINYGIIVSKLLCNMTRLTALLDSLGLGKTEQELYLAGLEVAEIGVSELVSRTGVNRTTAYHALGTLKDKGFCHESKVGGKLMYIMTRPEYLVQMLSRRQASLETQKHELTELLDEFPSPVDAGEQISVEKFDGINGVKAAVDKALYARERKWRIIAPKSNIFAQLPDEYAKYFMSTRMERGIQAKTLWEANDRHRAHLSLEQLLMRRPRYLDESMTGQFSATIIQFDDKVLFIHSIKHKSAAMITSHEVAQTFSVMFDGLWNVSEKPE